MDLSTSPIDNQSNNNNNSKTECANDANPTHKHDFDTQNDNPPELFDIDSSDLEYGCSDNDDRDESSKKSETVIESKSEIFSHEELNDDSCNDDEISDTAIPNECHSNEKHSDIHIEQTEISSIPTKQANNCSEGEEKGEDGTEAVAINDDNAEEEEPIFDFLGKANQIVCYIYI